jgi:hypothetical protein
MRLLNRPIAMPSRLELHHTNVHRFGTSPVCQRTAKLRGHRLITKVGKSRLYRVTARGIKAMWPAIRFRKNDFPIDFQRLASAGC